MPPARTLCPRRLPTRRGLSLSCKAITSALLLVVAVAGCAKRPASNATPAGLAPPAILAAVPQPGVILRIIEQPGVIHPDEETHLLAKVSGYVRRVHADIGQRVT